MNPERNGTDMPQQTRLRRRAALAAAVAALSVTLAGCGSAGSGSGTGAAGAAPAGPAPALNAAPPLAGGLDPTQFCAVVVKLAQATLQRESANPNTANDPSSTFAARAADWAKLVPLAPAEIEPDVQQIADGMQKIASGGDPASITQSLSAPLHRYIQYGSQHCPKPTG
ncbi:MAG: hypothetical protein QOI50_953 [Pseudonocardiales bacterium]|nr:hypothetical protein [Pseudonocardiales bacterium]